MSRLTKYEPNTGSMFPYRLKDEELSTKLDSIHKLGELEDIEEELGIELEVLFSALKNGVYYFAYDGQLTHDYVWLEDDYVCTGQRSKLSLSFRTFSEVDTLLFEDYGKTWFLVKKDLTKKELKMKILSNKEQNKLIEKIMELNLLIANSNVDLEAFDLLGDIMCSALDMRHTNRVKDALIEELIKKGLKENENQNKTN